MSQPLSADSPAFAFNMETRAIAIMTRRVLSLSGPLSGGSLHPHLLHLLPAGRGDLPLPLGPLPWFQNIYGLHSPQEPCLSLLVGLHP